MLGLLVDLESESGLLDMDAACPDVHGDIVSQLTVAHGDLAAARSSMCVCASVCVGSCFGGKQEEVRVWILTH